MKVYVVTAGDYSDYKIVAIFSTEEKADAYIRAREAIYPYSDFNSVTTWYVDDDNDDMVLRMAAQGLQSWGFLVLPNGTVTVSHSDLNEDWDDRHSVALVDSAITKAVGRCWARDEEHARKIAAEMYAELLARLDMGVTTPA